MQQKAIGVHRSLVIIAAEVFAHLGVELGDGHQRIGNFAGARSDQVHAAVTGHHRR